MLLISQFNFYVVNQILSLINLCFPTQGSITSRLHWCTPSCCNDSLLLTTLYDREFYSSNLHFYLHLYNFQIIANYCTLCGLENSSKRKVFQNRLSECHIYMCLNLTLYCYIQSIFPNSWYLTNVLLEQISPTDDNFWTQSHVLFMFQLEF